MEDDAKSIGNVERKAENAHPELAHKIDIRRKDHLLQQKVNDSKVAFNDLNDKSLEFTNPNNENVVKGKSLCFIDGIETDFDLLKNTTYTADSIMIMTPESAIAKYGEKAKYGSIELFNAKFNNKN